MTNRRSLVLLVPLSIASSAAALGCGGDSDICRFRGGPDAYHGSEVYTIDSQLNLSNATTAQEPLPSGYVGTTDSDSVIDWDPYAQRRAPGGGGKFCNQNGVGFEVTTNDCSFNAYVTSAEYQNAGSDRPLVSATATISGGECAFFVPGGAAKVIIKEGTISWPDLENVHIEATGEVQTWTFNLPDRLPDTREITVKFDGQTHNR